MAVTVPNQSTTYESDILIRRGDSFSQDFIFTGRNYTDYEFKCQVRDIYDGRIIMNITPTFVTYAGSATTINITKSSTQTDIRPGRWEYDLVATHPDGSPDLDVLKGLFTIEGDVTANVANLLEDEDGGNIDVG